MTTLFFLSLFLPLYSLFYLLSFLPSLLPPLSPLPPQTCMKKWSRYDVARAGELGGHETPLEEGTNQEGTSQTTNNIARYARRLYQLIMF